MFSVTMTLGEQRMWSENDFFKKDFKKNSHLVLGIKSMVVDGPANDSTQQNISDRTRYHHHLCHNSII